MKVAKPRDFVSMITEALNPDLVKLLKEYIDIRLIPNKVLAEQLRGLLIHEQTENKLDSLRAEEKQAEVYRIMAEAIALIDDPAKKQEAEKLLAEAALINEQVEQEKLETKHRKHKYSEIWKKDTDLT